MKTWQIQHAKNKLSEVIELARDSPQILTQGDVEVAVVLSIDEYRRLAKPETDLVDFFQSSPLAGEEDVDLEPRRSLI